MTTTTTPPVPLPAGALADDVWQEDDRPRRIIHSENRGVEGQDLVVWWDATQFADGTLDIEGNPPTVRVADLIWERGLSSAQARELAAVSIEGADAVDRWAAWDCHERAV
jgi:hypothetical protein